MKTGEVTRLRLRQQGIDAARFRSPADVVRRFGAVQAQDYNGALWALGLRLSGANEEAVERAVVERSIVRTWPMRGTLHFVAAEDVRWMLELLGARTLARAASRYRQLGLDDATFEQSRRVLARELEGGRQLTRAELAAAFERGGIATEGQRLLHILQRTSLEGLTCYAARRGRQLTFALLEEWAPSSKRLSREEALAELAGRYFRSHGPATLQDFVWWSSLTTTDARAGLETAKPRLRREEFDGHTCWLSTTAAEASESSPTAHLLPPYDEYTVAYKDRGALLHPALAREANAAGIIFSPTVLVDGLAVGSWKRRLERDTVLVETNLRATLKRNESRALGEAARRYGEFVGMNVEVT